MARTLSNPVIKESFEQVLGRLASTVLDDCINEFTSTYMVLGIEDAFKRALGEKAPSVDEASYDNLLLRFESAVKAAQIEQKEKTEQAAERREQRRKEAKTDVEKAAAKQEADDLKREVNAGMAAFKLVLEDIREVNREILAKARDVRKLARDSGYETSDAVIRALGATSEVSGKDGEAERLINDTNDLLKEAQEAVRNGDATSIETSTNAIESILNRLRDIRAVELPEARLLVEAAIAAANDEKLAKEKETVIQDAVNAAKGNLDAIDGENGIVKKAEAAVWQYRQDVNARTGADPVDNPDAVVTSANNALTAAKAANEDVVREAAAGRQAETEAAAARVATARRNAQTALDDINGRSNALNAAKAAEEARAGYAATQQKKADEEKAKKDGQLDRFLSSWKGHLTMLSLFAVGIVLALLFGSWWVQIGATVAAPIVLIVYGRSLLREEGRKNAAPILGSFFFIVLGLLLLAQLFGVADTGPLSIPGSDDPTPTATTEPRSQQDTVGDFQAGFATWSPRSPTPDN